MWNETNMMESHKNASTNGKSFRESSAKNILFWLLRRKQIASRWCDQSCTMDCIRPEARIHRCRNRCYRRHRIVISIVFRWTFLLFHFFLQRNESDEFLLLAVKQGNEWTKRILIEFTWACEMCDGDDDTFAWLSVQVRASALKSMSLVLSFSLLLFLRLMWYHS